MVCTPVRMRKGGRVLGAQVHSGAKGTASTGILRDPSGNAVQRLPQPGPSAQLRERRRANRGNDRSSCSQGLDGRRTQVVSNIRLNAWRVTTRTIMAQSSTARSSTEQSAPMFVRGSHDLFCQKTTDRRVEKNQSRSSLIPQGLSSNDSSSIRTDPIRRVQRQPSGGSWGEISGKLGQRDLTVRPDAFEPLTGETYTKVPALAETLHLRLIIFALIVMSWSTYTLKLMAVNKKIWIFRDSPGRGRRSVRRIRSAMGLGSLPARGMTSVGARMLAGEHPDDEFPSDRHLE